MVALLCAIVCIFCILICIRDGADFFHPVRLLNLMWLAVHLLNFVLGWNSNELLYLILLLPSLCFTIGFLFCEKVSIRAKEREHQELTVPNLGTPTFFFKHTYINASLLLVLVVFLFYVYSFVSRLGEYGGFNGWVALRRITWEYGVNDQPIFKYVSTLAFLLPSICLIVAQRSKRKIDYFKFVLSLMIAVVWSYIRTSRTSTFIVILLLAMSQIMLMENPAKKMLSLRAKKKLKRKKRRMFIAATAFMVVLFLFVALRKSTDDYGDVSRIEFYLRSISNYTNLSSAAFVEWYKKGFTYSNGANSFRFLFAIADRLGLSSGNIVANSGGLFITYEGMRTNAFTVARAYVEDFGVGYMAFIMGVFGMIHGAIYKRAKKETGLMKVRFALINAMLDIPLFYQILTNQYLNVLSGWIQYVLWICFFTSPVVWRIIKTKRDAKISEPT